jgi:hypothetical protein
MFQLFSNGVACARNLMGEPLRARGCQRNLVAGASGFSRVGIEKFPQGLRRLDTMSQQCQHQSCPSTSSCKVGSCISAAVRNLGLCFLTFFLFRLSKNVGPC